jgi:uncharacterized damage-inducible protein DinB
MNVADLQRLYDYGYWANARLTRVVSELTAGQFTQAVAGGHGSIRNTLVHVLSAEWGWLSRCGGPERGPTLKPDDYPTLQALMTAWSTVEGYVRRFLASLKDEDLARIVEFTNPQGEKRSLVLGEVLQHAAHHGVHHRGQVALLLRLLGHAPGTFDLLFYDAERRGVPAW